MPRKALRYLALLLAIGIAFALVYARIDHHQHGATHSTSLYQCPMHPEITSEKPGDCPKCGMKLELKQAVSPRNVSAPSQPPATKPAGGPKVLYWYDPMHPQYKADKPGKAPDCGMDLVPKYAEDGGGQPGAPDAHSMPPGAVMIPADRQQLIGVRTAPVAREDLTRTVRTTGQVVADESKIAHVHVKVSGFLDQVFANYTGALISKGDRLFTVYSPDLVATQHEYLLAKRGERQLGKSQFAEVSDGAQSLLRSARERLKLWDMTDTQIAMLDQSGEVSRTITFHSPVTGIVLDRKAFPQVAVNPDTELYTLADLSTVWVNADVYESEVPYVKVGQRADIQLSYYPGKTWHGRVAFVYPMADANTHTVKIRIELPNPGLQLKPQMFADVQLRIAYGTQIVVPQEAVMNSGAEQTVFVVRDGSMFEPRRIQIGAQLDGKTVVLSGLKPGETIVTSGNFLIDSESRMKGPMAGMQH